MLYQLAAAPGHGAPREPSQPAMFSQVEDLRHADLLGYGCDRLFGQHPGLQDEAGEGFMQHQASDSGFLCKNGHPPGARPTSSAV